MNSNTLDKSYFDLQATEEMASSSVVPSSTAPEGKQPALSFPTREMCEGSMVGFDKIPELEGQMNYSVWEASLKLIFKTLKLYDTVVVGAKPADDAEEDEKEAYDHLCDHAKIVFMQTVSSSILERILEIENPHAIWNWLRTKFDRDNSFTRVFQIANLTSLQSRLDTSKSINDFISLFEVEWLRLSKLVIAPKDEYRKTFAKFLNEDKAKRDFLLAFLVNTHQNIVHELCTRGNLTYVEVKQRLLDIPGPSESNSQTARHRTKGKSKGKAATPSEPKSKICTWCAKHKPGRENGHVWNECFSLKKFKDSEKKKEEAQQGESSTTRFVTALQGPVQKS